VLLEQRGDVEGAEAAYRRADDRGDATAAFNLAALLVERGDLDGAEAAYERAGQRGDASATFNLGVLLERRGDFEGAATAYGRAAEDGPAEVAEKAREAALRLQTHTDAKQRGRTRIGMVGRSRRTGA